MTSIIDIRTYIREHPGVSLNELALRFKTSEPMMEALLSRLVERGDVESYERPKCTGSCCCSGDARQCYRPTRR